MKTKIIILLAALFATQIIAQEKGTEEVTINNLNLTPTEETSQSEISSKLYGIFHLGVLFSGDAKLSSGENSISGEVDDKYMTLGGVVGFKIVENVRLGVGFDYTFLDGSSVQPLYGDLRVKIAKWGNVSPFIMGGYGVMFGKDVNEGTFHHLGLGCEIELKSHNNSLFFALSYRSYNDEAEITLMTPYSMSYKSKVEAEYSFLTFTLGMCFN